VYKQIQETNAQNSKQKQFAALPLFFASALPFCSSSFIIHHSSLKFLFLWVTGASFFDKMGNYE
jgi:hypothetical protein